MSVGVSLLLLIASFERCPVHHQGSLVVRSARDVPDCLETVNGDLIVGSSEHAIVFSDLTDITGRLDVTLSERGVLRLPRLERVHRGLEAELRGLAALDVPRLTHVGEALGLDLDPEKGAGGFPRLRRHAGGLWIFGGGSMDALLPVLESVGGTVFIQPSGPLRGVLPGLGHIGGHLVVNNAGHLPLEGLAQLGAVDGGLYLFGGMDVDLPRLRYVGGALAVRDTRFQNLDRLGGPGTQIGALLLRDNPALERWPAHLEVPASRVLVEGSPALRGRPRE